MALVACPTASIGTESHRSAHAGVTAFPVHVVDDVYYCGFNSEASFGAWSYLIVRPKELGGNVLVDSPRFNNPLVKRIEEMGGVNLMLLSHRDDIADHAKFAAHFHCPRVMHEADGATDRGIERVISGVDHLAWSPERGTLTAFRDVCWSSWTDQTRSMEKLLDYRFEWVLPGHGRIGHGSAEEMHRHLQSCVERMKKQ
jgi:glyoxylase-like metal-dependent hydrolase (beta-lactamase superfamily II)